jgi:hypothetical protein
MRRKNLQNIFVKRVSIVNKIVAELKTFKHG